MAEYISREKAINAIKSLESSMPAKDNYAKGYDAALGRVLIAVREVPPAADVQPVVHAYWIELPKLPKALNRNENPCKCSNCGHTLIFMNGYPKSKRCDDCGARMDGDTNLVSVSEHAYTESELAVKIRQMQETIQRLDGENYKLTEKLEEIGTAFNEQVSLVGWYEERVKDLIAELEKVTKQEKEYKRLLKAAVNEMAQLGEQCSDNAIHCCNCPFEECGKFSFHDEIMELIGGEGG